MSKPINWEQTLKSMAFVPDYKENKLEDISGMFGNRAEKDIFEERQINPHYKAKVLLARAGQKISVDKARELGLL
jgi:hypothetical protein